MSFSPAQHQKMVEVFVESLEAQGSRPYVSGGTWRIEMGIDTKRDQTRALDAVAQYATEQVKDKRKPRHEAGVDPVEAALENLYTALSNAGDSLHTRGIREHFRNMAQDIQDWGVSPREVQQAQRLAEI